MFTLPTSIQRLITEFSKLPGIGPKSSARLTFHLLHQPVPDVQNLGEAVLALKKDLKLCAECYNITEGDLCSVCGDSKRLRHQIMVVEEPLDVVAFERTNEYRGLYHVLHGVLSPIEGIGPEQLKMTELFTRLRAPHEGDLELILATNPSLEGEATASFIHQHVQDIPLLKITRIARGLPVGGDLEYADEVTLGQALSGRRDY